MQIKVQITQSDIDSGKPIISAIQRALQPLFPSLDEIYYADDTIFAATSENSQELFRRLAITLPDSVCEQVDLDDPAQIKPFSFTINL